MSTANKSDSLNMQLNSTVLRQATNHFEHLPNPLVLGGIPAFCPPAVLTVRGHCHNVGTAVRPDLCPSARDAVICRAGSLAS